MSINESELEAVMAKRITVGFPRMNKEASERRVFLPAFIQCLTQYADIYLEEGYGSRSGFTFDDYCQGNRHVIKTDRLDTFQKDYVVVLRSPNEDEFRIMRRGACLVSMLHYPTRPHRVQLLNELGIKAISMDSIIDDSNIRLVENMRAVAWNGLETAFDVLEKDCPNLLRGKQTYQVLILGTGMVGKYAVDAATKLGSVERNNRHIELGGPGSIAVCVGRNLSADPQRMEPLFRQADVLVDATYRRDPSKPVVPNTWLAWLPKHAVIADLAVDPYLLDHQPQTVRGVEGIPQGNLNQYVFYPDDPNWEKTVPASIPSEHRRTVVSCYSWPGIHPEACMEHYARQLEPVMEVLLTRPYDPISLDGNYFERALARAKLP
jgi:alanine dehydrogenase